VSFAAITLCDASQLVIPKVSVYFVIDSVQKLLDTPSYVFMALYIVKHRYNSTLPLPHLMVAEAYGWPTD
jgi:hypothetical protein